MSHIHTRQAIASKTDFAGRSWFYNFRELQRSFEERKCRAAVQTLAYRYAKITKDWTPEKNSEWLCRIYFSAKTILSATLHLNADEYAESENLRLVSPYLRYYSFLYLVRGIVLMLPEANWDDGEILKIGHSSAINQAFSHISIFDKDLAEEIRTTAYRLKANRELISYKSPSSADQNIESIHGIDRHCTLLSEIIQFSSEIMETSIIKNADDSAFVFLPEYMEKLTDLEIEESMFFDKEDCYRLDYLRRKHPAPPNVQHIMTEGHVEDFFGAWTAEDDLKKCFDPDENWQRIFDIP